MRKIVVLSLLWLYIGGVQAQSFRESIIHADLIVEGYLKPKGENIKKDYSSFLDTFVVNEVIKGEYKEKTLLVSSYSDILLFEFDLEEPVKHIYFLKKADNHYYTINNCKYKLVKPIKEMLEISRIKKDKKRYAKTIDWSIKILEDCTPHDSYINYFELDKYSGFLEYNQKKGLVTLPEEILNQEQKDRIINSLLLLNLWDRSECDFAKLIYTDYPEKIEEHILKMLNSYFENTNYISLYDIESLLKVLSESKNKEAIEKLIDKLDTEEYRKKLIENTTKELKKILQKQ